MIFKKIKGCRTNSINLGNKKRKFSLVDHYKNLEKYAELCIKNGFDGENTAKVFQRIYRLKVLEDAFEVPPEPLFYEQYNKRKAANY